MASLLRLRSSLERDGRIRFASRGALEAVEALLAARPDLIVVEEASMLGNSTAADLWTLAQEAGAALLLVGDAAQLPPVNQSMARLFLNPPWGQS